MLLLVSRLSKTLRGLASLAHYPWRLNHMLATDTADWQQCARAHAQRDLTAQGLPTVPLTHFLSPTAPHTVRPFVFREGGSLPTDLLLLRALAGQKPQCRYFEIGTWRGESAANVAASVHILNLSAVEMRDLG